MTRSVLVTGGAGFIGYHVAGHLAEKGYLVTIVDNLVRGECDGELQNLLNRDSVTFINGDICDPNVVEKLSDSYDYIYHFAAIIGVKNVMEKPDEVLRVNSSSAINLLRLAAGCKGLKRFLFSSTSEVYAGTLRHFGISVPTDESVKLTIDDITCKRTTYALSKLFGESACFMYARQHQVPVTIVRYHNVYGPRMGYAHVIPEMFAKIARNRVVDVSSPRHTRAFCYIDDAVDMTVKISENKDSIGEIYHVGNPREEIAIRDLVLKIAHVMQTDIEINEQPDTDGSPLRRCPDTDKIDKVLGYKERVPLHEGLVKTYEWYKDKAYDRY